MSVPFPDSQIIQCFGEICKPTVATFPETFKDFKDSNSHRQICRNNGLSWTRENKNNKNILIRVDYLLRIIAVCSGYVFKDRHSY